MKKRVISAIVAILIVIPLIALGGYAYYVGVGILSILGFYEIVKVYESKHKLPLLVKMLSICTYLIIVLSSVLKTTFEVDYRTFIFNAFVCLLPLIVYKKEEYNAEDAFFLLASTMFLGLSFHFLIVIRNLNVFYLLYVLIVTTVSDTFAHFFGTKIGKYKLCPLVSPNKTIEGFIGGTLFGTFFGVIVFNTFVSTDANIFLLIIISLALSIIAECGDLIFSAIKRNFDVKDFGNIMPGHGGVLDRLDSIILAMLAFSYLVSFF